MRGRRPDSGRRDGSGPREWGRLARTGAGSLYEEPSPPAGRAREQDAKDASTEPALAGPEKVRRSGTATAGASLARSAPKTRSAAGNRAALRRSPLPPSPRPAPDPRTELARVQRADRGKRSARRFDAAARAFRASRFDEARLLVAPLAREVHDIADVRELHGLALYRLGRFKAAMNELEAFRELSGSVEQHPVLADCHRALRRWADVDALWSELGSVSPSAELMTEGRIVTAGAKADRGDVGAAIGMLEDGWRLPSRPRPHHLRRAYALADLYEVAGRSPKARELFRWVEAHDSSLVDVSQRVRALS